MGHEKGVLYPISIAIEVIPSLVKSNNFYTERILSTNSNESQTERWNWPYTIWSYDVVWIVGLQYLWKWMWWTEPVSNILKVASSCSEGSFFRKEEDCHYSGKKLFCGYPNLNPYPYSNLNPPFVSKTLANFGNNAPDVRFGIMTFLKNAKIPEWIQWLCILAFKQTSVSKMTIVRLKGLQQIQNEGTFFPATWSIGQKEFVWYRIRNIVKNTISEISGDSILRLKVWLIMWVPMLHRNNRRIR